MDRIKRGTEAGTLFEFQLSEVEEHLFAKNRTNEFIESVREQWDQWGSVSKKQKEAVEKFYEKVGL